MSNRILMKKFINEIKKNKLLTLFISILFDYDNFNDYNYLFRMESSNDNIIIDIFDNVSDNRFNRYIFMFNSDKKTITVIEKNNVFVTYIPVLNVENNDNKLVKLAYLFKLNNKDMIDYADSFLPKEIVLLLSKIINKSI